MALAQKKLLELVQRYNPLYQRLGDFLKSKPLMLLNIMNDQCYVITGNDTLNHDFVKGVKADCSDFLNSLTMIGYNTRLNGEIGFSNEEYKYYTDFGQYVIMTSVKCTSETERKLWLTVFHTYKVLLRVKETGHIMFESGEIPTGSNEDVLSEVDVVDVAQNTAITKEMNDSSNLTTENNNILPAISTTEPFTSLAPLSERWIKLIFNDPVQLSTSDDSNHEVLSLNVPNGLFDFFDSATATAVRNYTLINTDIEIRIVVNANQSQCGRYVMAHYPCYSQVDNTRDNVWRQLTRDHAIIDIGKSNDVRYTIKYENLRPFVPVQQTEVGEVTGGTFARFTLTCLSPIRISDTGNPTCPITVYVKLLNPKLVGMRYPIPTFESGEIPATTSPLVLSTTRSINRAIGSVPMVGALWRALGAVTGNSAVAIAKMLSSDSQRIKNFEDNLNYIGMINKDRPVDISHPTPLMPQPVHSYSYGRGPYSSKKMRLEPEATTPHLDDHITANTTDSLLDLAQISGFCTSFFITNEMVPGTTLIRLPAIPFDPRFSTIYPSISTDDTGVLLDGRQLPPVSYISGMFSGYSGSIEYEFVAVKTATHNFSIQVGFIPFNGDVDITDAQLQSCRWKTMDFRTSNNSSFVVPWLSTDVMRLYPRSVIGNANQASSLLPNTANYFRPGEMTDPGQIIVKLVNPLNPTPIVSPNIEILVMVKASKNLRFIMPCQFRFTQFVQPNIYAFTRESLNSTTYGPPSLDLITYPINGAIPRFESGEAIQLGDEQTMIGDIVSQAYGPQVQTMEKHDNILDVCRRFSLHATLTGTRLRIVDVPIGPFLAKLSLNTYSVPSYAGPLVDDGMLVGDCYPTLLPENIRDAITKGFRFFRGSMNYVIHNLSDYPIEIAVTPADGPLHYISGGLDDTLSTKRIASGFYPLDALPISTGFPNEVIEYRVNPMQTIEIPLYNSNNYIDLQAFCTNFIGVHPSPSARPQQDVRSLYLGNMIIKQLTNNNLDAIASNDPLNAFKVRIMSAFGDDARLYHFMGFPPVSTGPGTRWNMVRPPARSVDRNRSRDEIEIQLLSEGVESNPGPNVLSTFFSYCSSGVKQVTDKAAIITDIKRVLMDSIKLSGTFSAAVDKSHSMLEEIKTVLALYCNGVSLCTVGALALGIVGAFKQGANKFSILSVIFQLLGIIGIFHIDVVNNAFSKLIGCVGEDKLVHEADFGNDMLVGTIVALFVETGHAITRVNVNEAYNIKYVTKVVSQMFNNFNFARAGAICIFFSRICNVVKILHKNVSKWIFGVSRYDLLSNDPKFIQSFMLDYEFAINELNLNQQSFIRKHKDRFWTTLITAHYIKNALATVTDVKARNPTLNQAVSEIIRRANDLKSQLSAPPVRYEPFVLWMHGPPGTGKTTLSSQLTVDMAKAIHVASAGNPIYTRSPNDEFWNGYSGQPIVLIDDANAVSDPTILGRALSEFQAIKSSANMKLSMPRLEDKNAEMQSLIVSVCSNLRSWKSSSIVDANAFLRRRDIVVKVGFTQQALKYLADHKGSSTRDLPDFMRKNNAHLEFSIADDVRAINSEQDRIPMCYNEFHKYLINKFVQYHKVEVQRATDRFVKALELSSTVATNVMDRRSLQIALEAVFLGSMSEKSQSEYMREMYLSLKTMIPTQFEKLPAHTQYLLTKMKESDITFESEMSISPKIRDVLPHASEWFKTRALPCYFEANPTRFSFLREKLMPWNTESRRKFETTDLLNTVCTVCREAHSTEREIAFLCARSTGENQHWLCKRCAPQFNRMQLDIQTCPVCRDQTLLEVYAHNGEWRLWHKAGYLLKLLGDALSGTVTRTMQTLWNNAYIVLMCTAIMTQLAIMGTVVQEHLSELDRNNQTEDAIFRFVSAVGVMPDRTFVDRHGRVIFEVNGYAYTSTPEGHIIDMLGFESDEKEYHTPNTSDGEYKVVKSKKQKKAETVEKIVAKALDMRKDNVKPSTSKEDSIDKRQAIIDNADVYLTFLDKIYDCVPIVKCMEHGKDMLKDVLKEKVKVSHIMMNGVNREKYTLQPTASLLTLSKDNTLAANVHADDDEFKCIVNKVERCENEKCMQNDNVKFLLYYYLLQEHDNNLIDCTNEIVFKKRDIPQYIQDMYVVPIIPPDNNRVVTKYAAFIDFQVRLVKHLQGCMYGWLKKIYKVLCETWQWILMLVAVLCAVYYGYSYYYSENEEIVIEFESDTTGRSTYYKQKQDRNASSLVLKRSLRHESYSVVHKIPLNVKSIGDLILKQVVSISCSTQIARGIVFRNNHFWMPKHAIDIISQLQRDGNPALMTLTDKTSIVLEKNVMDYVVKDGGTSEYFILKHMRVTGKDIRGHIYQTNVQDVIYDSYAFAVDIQDYSMYPVEILSVNTGDEHTAVTIPLVRNINDKEYRYESKLMDHLVVTNLQGAGKCGSVVMNARAQIIGIHFAGNVISNEKRGYSAPVFRTEFEVPDDIVQIQHESQTFENLKPYSRYHNPPYHIGKSALKPSAIAENAWESLTIPCIQSHKDKRYQYGDTPLKDGASTIGALTIPPETHTLFIAMTSVAEELFKYMPSPYRKPPVSITEAVVAEHAPHVEKMRLDTSAGLPLITQCSGSTFKSRYVVVCEDRDRKYVQLDENFKVMYDACFNMRKHNEPPRQPFWAHLKDERRKPEKVLSFGGTRVFNVAPLELVITSRRVLLPFMNAFHSSPLNLHHGIGIAPDSIKWTLMVEKLRMKGSSLIQLDFSKFSDSMPWEFVHAAFNIIKMYYIKYNMLSHDVDAIIDTLYYEITRSVVCVDDIMYELQNGVLQGHPITSIINSLVNILEQTYVWMKITGLPGSEFFHNCGIYVMGDDVVISVPNHLRSKYDGKKVQEEFARMKIVVTDENKDPHMVQCFQPFNEFSFLSRTYQLHPYRKLYLSPADMESVFDTPLWIRRSDGPYYDATIENCEQSLMLMYGHGPVMYEMYRSLLEFLMNGKSFRSWYELDYIFYGNEEITPEMMENVGLRYGSEPKVTGLLKAKLGRISPDIGVPSKPLEAGAGRMRSGEIDILSNQYHDADFLRDVVLDTHGTVTGKYRCRCKYKCEDELMKRIAQVEAKTGTPREQFLPFTSQEVGTGILGARIMIVK